MSTTTSTAVAPSPRLAGVGRATGLVAVLTAVLLAVGRAAGWHGFGSSDKDVSAASTVLFLAFVLSVVVTLALAVALLVKRDRAASLPLFGALALAVVVSALEAAGVFG